MIVSIDIGTSYSCISMLCPDGSVQSVDIGTGISMYGTKYSLPSAIFVENDGSIVLGQAAINNRVRNPQNFRDEFKRNLGEDYPIILGGRSFLPEDIYTELLRHMKTCAENISGESITLAYLTHPASYSKAKKEKLIAAANAAGLFHVELVDEPTAAAMGYCASGYIKNDQNVMVYDFGGGTFDVALIHHEDGVFTPLADPKGLERCGGIDIDRLLFRDMQNAVSADTLKTLQQNQLQYLRFVCQLAELAVQCKHHFSSPGVNAFEGYITTNLDLIPYRLTRETFDQMIAGLVGQTIQTCRQTLEEAKLKIHDLSAILMVGGTSRVRLVREMVEQMAGDVPVYVASDLELAVSQGVLSLNMDQLMERLRIEKLQEEERIRKEKELAAQRAAKTAEIQKLTDLLSYVNNTKVAQLKREQFIRTEELRVKALMHTPLHRIPCRMVLDKEIQNGTLRLFRNRLEFMQTLTKQTLTIPAADIVKFRKGTIIVQTRQEKMLHKTRYQFKKMKRSDLRLLEEYLLKNKENQAEMKEIATTVARIEAEERERIRQEKRKVEINCRLNSKPGTLYLKPGKMTHIAIADKSEATIYHSNIETAVLTEALRGNSGKFALCGVAGFVILAAVLIIACSGIPEALVGIFSPIMFFSSMSALRPMANLTVKTGTKTTFWGKEKNLYTNYCIDYIDKDQREHLAAYLEKVQKNIVM